MAQAQTHCGCSGGSPTPIVPALMGTKRTALLPPQPLAGRCRRPECWQVSHFECVLTRPSANATYTHHVATTNYFPILTTPHAQRQPVQAEAGIKLGLTVRIPADPSLHPTQALLLRLATPHQAELSARPSSSSKL